MTILGWLMRVCSWGGIAGLSFYSLYKVMTIEKKKNDRQKAVNTQSLQKF